MGALLAGCSPAERAVAPELQPGAPRLAVAAAAALPPVRISEIHYDNTGTDTGEAIEISGPANTNLAGWSLVLYNGSPTSRASYGTTNLTQTIPATCGTRGVVVITYPSNGIQNGGSGSTEPDGVALVNASGQVVEFLSYEGSFVAANGPASGLTSTNIGAFENGTEPVGQSLQRTGAGTWAGPVTSTFGSCNDADEVPPAVVASVTVAPATATVVAGTTTTLAATAKDAGGLTIPGTSFTWTSGATGVATVDANGVVTGVAAGSTTITAAAANGVSGTATVTVTAASGSATNVRVSEFHYDNDGTDAGEKIEIEGDVNGSVAGWSLVLYSGSTGSATQGQSYATLPLTGTFSACSAGSTRGVLTFDAVGLQNGDKDGFALVNAAGAVIQFLSYEGSFTATNGPAAGMTSVDVGVEETGTTPAGRSLQRAGNGTWFGPATSTFGACNPATPPAAQTGITFSGRLSSDAPIPVGFQDQVFATERDANTGAAITTTFTWTSETPAIVSVDARGVVTALTAGTGVIRATATDGATATLSLATEVATFGDAALYRNPLAFGTPADATPGDELLVQRDQYKLSYSKARGTPNWVAYHLTKANRGDLPGYRCDCFATDPAVTGAGEVGLTTADYTGSGFDRGHMVRSNDRELAHGDQATTYYLSNIVPQYANLNQGRWADLESYLQTVAEGATRPEVYIFAGPRGAQGTIAGGRITVPTATWKVAVVLPAGMTPAAITKPSDILDVIAVDMPNVSTLARDGNWAAHRVTVDSVEKATGYDLLSALPNAFEEVVESGDKAPTARIAGAGTAGGSEGATLAFDASTSVDPDVGGPLHDVLSYQWSVNGQAVGIQPALSYAFADNGTYTLRLIVADRFGAADTATTTVTIANVAPTVPAFAGATILRGETYQATGGFADPGADTWTATVDYGDGSGAQPLALTGKTFALSHAYATAGTFTVAVTVRDDDAGTGTRTATVKVETAVAGANALAAMVQQYADAGTLEAGIANSLAAKLRAAARQLAADATRPAGVNVLGAFVAELDALVQSGRLTAEQAAPLADYARRVIASAGA